MPPTKAAEEEPDGYFLPDGRFVFTASYHRRRGSCCGNGCVNCPFEFEAVAEPRRSQLQADRKGGST